MRSSERWVQSGLRKFNETGSVDILEVRGPGFDLTVGSSRSGIHSGGWQFADVGSIEILAVRAARLDRFFGSSRRVVRSKSWQFRSSGSIALPEVRCIGLERKLGSFPGKDSFRALEVLHDWLNIDSSVEGGSVRTMAVPMSGLDLNTGSSSSLAQHRQFG